MEVLEYRTGNDQFFLRRSKVKLTDHDIFDLGLEGRNSALCRKWGMGET